MPFDAFAQLAMESERTLFMFYGYRKIDGSQGGGYFKLAHSLSEALEDLHSNPAVANEGGYFVRDAFLEMNDHEPIVHVELISVSEALAQVGGDPS